MMTVRVDRARIWYSPSHQQWFAEPQVNVRAMHHWLADRPDAICVANAYEVLHPEHVAALLTKAEAVDASR